MVRIMDVSTFSNQSPPSRVLQTELDCEIDQD